MDGLKQERAKPSKEKWTLKEEESVLIVSIGGLDEETG